MKKKFLSLLVIASITMTACSTTSTSTSNIQNSKRVESTDSNIKMLSSFTGEKVSQSGPYGTISITLPKEWSYTLCEVDDTKLKVGDYGIHFYPSEEKWGYVEVAYASLFGVCGTGLETKEVTLAGDKAEMGFYDGSDIWEFVAFEGKNEKIVASTSGVSSWWAKYSEEVLEILNTLSYNK